MKISTLCLLRRPGEILLAMKKRGFGAGRFNGVGGKLQKGESIEEAALREMEEEIEVKAEKHHLHKVGRLQFYFPEERQEWNQEVHIYFVYDWDGEPAESEEMRPEWFAESAIPFDQMWPDDQLWLPRSLAGDYLEGEFYFGGDCLSFDRYDLRKRESGFVVAP